MPRATNIFFSPTSGGQFSLSLSLSISLGALWQCISLLVVGKECVRERRRVYVGMWYGLCVIGITSARCETYARSHTEHGKLNKRGVCGARAKADVNTCEMVCFKRNS